MTICLGHGWTLTRFGGGAILQRNNGRMVRGYLPPMVYDRNKREWEPEERYGSVLDSLYAVPPDGGVVE